MAEGELKGVKWHIDDTIVERMQTSNKVNVIEEIQRALTEYSKTLIKDDNEDQSTAQ